MDAKGGPVWSNRIHFGLQPSGQPFSPPHPIHSNSRLAAPLELLSWAPGICQPGRPLSWHPCPQLQSSSAKPSPFLLLAGSLHAITFFSLSTLVMSTIIACLGTCLRKLQRTSDYEVSCQPAFPPLVPPTRLPGATAPGHPPGQHHKSDKFLPFAVMMEGVQSGPAVCAL